MDLNEVLYGLTHIGPEGFPISRPQLLDILTGFGMKQNEHRMMALEMLQLAGHIDFVIDRNGRGFYRLARPHLRPRPDGSFILAGARSPNMLPLISATLDSGTSWRSGEIVIIQPDIAIVSMDVLNEVDEEVVSALGANGSQEMKRAWTMPPGNLPNWEAIALESRQKITNP